jgi:hypothetical protein
MVDDVEPASIGAREAVEKGDADGMYEYTGTAWITHQGNSEPIADPRPELLPQLQRGPGDQLADPEVVAGDRRGPRPGDGEADEHGGA